MITLSQVRKVHHQIVKRKQRKPVAVAEEREGEGEVAQPQHHPEGPEAVEGGEEEVQREEKTMFQVICTQFLFLFHTNFMRTHIQA